MASFYAELVVVGHYYQVRFCQFDFTQSTDERGRVVGKVRHGLVHLTLDVPHDDFLLNWAAALHKPLDGHVTFFETSQRIARETVSFAASECVGYSETFETGNEEGGAYVCHLTIAALELEPKAKGPSSPLVLAPLRDYAYVPPKPLKAVSEVVKEGGYVNLKLGPNEEYREAILEASKLTGIDAADIACVISAEAKPNKNGKWDPISKPPLKKNGKPSSTALGLTQFIDDTWLKMAKKPGSFLNKQAKELHLIDEKNRIISGAEGKLLKLRENPTTSIITAAEYGKGNLKELEKAGIQIPNDPTERARYMYIAHHEGPSGAKEYLTNSLDEDRAEELLVVNRGKETAAADIKKHGTANAAYKDFLENYSKDRIKPDKFRNPKVDAFPDSAKNMA